MSFLLTISDVSRRSGVAASALRFYEGRGLIKSERIARMMGEFEAFGFFDHVAHLQRHILCDDCRSSGASIEDDFTNELFLPE